MKRKAYIFVFVVPLLTILVAKQSYAQTTVTRPEKPEVPELPKEFREKARARAYEHTYSTGHSTNGGKYFFVSNSNQSSSQLSISKTYSGETTMNEGTFEVDDGTRHISISLSGSLKKGSIVITLLLPDGKEFKKMTLDESADISFSQNLSISEDESRYYGKWTYKIDAKSADGSYRLMLRTG